MNGSSSGSAWWQLLRAGNVFTAVSNVLAGYLLARGEWQPVLPLVFLILSSAFLYLAGMVLNDVFDLGIDRVERPERPLPSGRIDHNMAKIVGYGLLVDGLSAAGVAAWLISSWLPLLIAASLACAIIFYDTRLKNTKLGPLTMGLCRALNILLGASIARSVSSNTPAFAYAVAIGIYTVGITLLARNETQRSRLPNLRIASAVTLLGCFLVGNAFDIDSPRGWSIPQTAVMLTCLGLVYFPLQHAMRQQTAVAVQAAVSRLISLFIVLDAAICWATAGWPAGLVVLSLLLPTYIATRRIPMT